MQLVPHSVIAILMIYCQQGVSDACPLHCNCTRNTNESSSGVTHQETIHCRDYDLRRLNLSQYTNVTTLVLENMDLNNAGNYSAILETLVNLQELILPRNRLQMLPSETVFIFKHLRKLDVSMNLISTLPVEVINISSNIVLNLSNNPIHCNCSTANVISKSNKENIIGNCSQGLSNVRLTELTGMRIGCDPCSPNQCFDGDCHSIDDVNFRCICGSRTTGKFCDKGLEYNCSEITQDEPICQNGGTCYDHNDHNYTCVCPPSFSGLKCEIKEQTVIGEDVIVAIIVTCLVAILIVITIYVYYKKIKPVTMQRRQQRRLSSKRRISQNDETNYGYNNDLDAGSMSSTTGVLPSNDDQKFTDYPHDPNYARWLPGRRRCSTVLEVEEKASRQGSVMELREG